MNESTKLYNILLENIKDKRNFLINLFAPSIGTRERDAFRHKMWNLKKLRIDKFVDTFFVSHINKNCCCLLSFCPGSVS